MSSSLLCSKVDQTAVFITSDYNAAAELNILKGIQQINGDAAYPCLLVMIAPLPPRSERLLNPVKPTGGEQKWQNFICV